MATDQQESLHKLTRHSATVAMPLENLLSALRPAAEVMGLPLAQKKDRAEIALEDATLTVAAARDTSLVTIAATSDARLATLRETVNFYFEQLNLPVSLQWAADRTGGRPANLMIGTIIANDRLSPSFQRLRISGDFSRFASEGLHFRLIFGPEGADWPSADATGATHWPGGIDSWHRPPYTVRAIDPDCGWIDIDVFLHDGGRVTEWLTRAAIGDIVAITGPGGKVPGVAGWIGYIGDETALPVIARMLEGLPAETTGQALIFVQDPKDAQDIRHPEGVDLRWMVHGEHGTPLDALNMLNPPEADRFVFFAAERAASIAAREYLSRNGFERGEYHAAAYWTEAWVPPSTQVARLQRRTAQVP